MKFKGIYIILFIFLPATLSAQVSQKVYYDSLWNYCNEANASYFRTVESINDDGLFKITDHYISGSKQMEGFIRCVTCSPTDILNNPSDSVGQKEGKYVYWHSNGQLSSEYNFNNGELVGKAVAYHENGTIS